MCELWPSASNGHPGPMFGSYPVVITIPGKTEYSFFANLQIFSANDWFANSEYDVIWEVQSNHG